MLALLKHLGHPLDQGRVERQLADRPLGAEPAIVPAVQSQVYLLLLAAQLLRLRLAAPDAGLGPRGRDRPR